MSDTASEMQCEKEMCLIQRVRCNVKGDVSDTASEMQCEKEMCLIQRVRCNVNRRCV